jgi:hypothetical protein
MDEAVEIAKQCPTLRLGLGLTVEIRPVADICPVLSADAPVPAIKAPALS